jgi:hypothetical protein
MRTRTQVGTSAASVPAASAPGTRVPAPAETYADAKPAAARVACPECFQVGEHMDGCPAKDNEPEPVVPPASAQEAREEHEAAREFERRTAEKVEARRPAPEVPRANDAVGRTIANHTEDVGQSVEVTWGEELFQPLQFNTFRVGPFRATTVVRKGESVAQAMLRMHVEMDRVAREIRDKKTEEYVAALKKIGGFVEQSRGGR